MALAVVLAQERMMGEWKLVWQASKGGGKGGGRFQSAQSTEGVKSFSYVLKVQIEERYDI